MNYHLQFSAKHILHNLVMIQLQTNAPSFDTPVQVEKYHCDATRGNAGNECAHVKRGLGETLHHYQPL